MPKNQYNLEHLEDCMSKLKSNPSRNNLSELRSELNTFIPESKCIECIYTPNHDKVFFGMKTLVVLTEDQVTDILLGDKIVKIEKYYLEIDSKLFEIGLTTKELTAFLLHEVGHCVIGGNTVSGVRKSLDTYFMKNKTSLSIKDSAQYQQILKYGITDAIYKMNSLFYMDNPEEVAADSFVQACGYGPYLVSGFNKLLYKHGTINKGIPKLATLEWTLHLYKEIKFKRIPALKLLNSAEKLSGSVLEKRDIKNLVNSLERLDDTIYNESTYILESDSAKTSLFGRLKTKGLKSIEEDLYEYSIRVSHAETETDAFTILGQINTRISILDEYLESNDLSDKERERWYKLMVKYQALREELSRKRLYNKKQYGLYFDYNQLDPATAGGV